MDTRWDGLLVNARLVTLAGDAGYGVIEDGAGSDGVCGGAGGGLLTRVLRVPLVVRR